jgi:glycosyltransferase involved in cell wall biosynthesis
VIKPITPGLANMTSTRPTIPIAVQHVITGLSTGGAEMMLLKLVSGGPPNVSYSVVSLADSGTIGPAISALGVPVYALGMSRATPDPLKLLALMRRTRQVHPDLIQGWMYHGNLMATLTAVAARGPVPVLWNIRQTVYDLARERRATALVIRLGALLSARPAAIIYNSVTSAQQHEALGYRREKRVILPNGFDCEMFRPDQEARGSFRRELGVPHDSLLVGLIARYHPMKDHAAFLRAAAIIRRSHPKVRFVLAGSGVSREEPALLNAIQREGLEGGVFLLGERKDTARINAALDVACSSSAWGEGFSNSIGEAMACAVPCVVTDIGDSSFLVGSTGTSVPAGDYEAFAKAVQELLQAGPERRSAMGQSARQRIETEFSLPSVVSRYQELYREHVLRSRAQGPSR